MRSVKKIFYFYIEKASPLKNVLTQPLLNGQDIAQALLSDFFRIYLFATKITVMSSFLDKSTFNRWKLNFVWHKAMSSTATIFMN